MSKQFQVKIKLILDLRLDKCNIVFLIHTEIQTQSASQPFHTKL